MSQSYRLPTHHSKLIRRPAFAEDRITLAQSPIRTRIRSSSCVHMMGISDLVIDRRTEAYGALGAAR